jgi:hypothetical protein
VRLVVLEDILEALADLAKDEAVDVILLDIFVSMVLLVLIFFCLVSVFSFLLADPKCLLVSLALFVEPFECDDELLGETKVLALQLADVLLILREASTDLDREVRHL